MKDSEQLSLEQKFNLRTFADLVQTLSSKEAQGLSIELTLRMMLKDNLYQELLRDCWDVGSFPTTA